MNCHFVISYQLNIVLLMAGSYHAHSFTVTVLDKLRRLFVLHQQMITLLNVT